jgi:MinD-like ATPase involved in chromosome partitioning or flagellar assembly
MATIVSIHSFRGGTGKSNLTANLAAMVAASGKRVGIVDTDVQSPGIHVLFGLDEDSVGRALNDYLWGLCAIEETARDVTGVLGDGAGGGTVFLIPSSIRAGEIARVLREGYDVALLNQGFRDLVQQLRLDFLFIDTHPGLNEETLLSIVLSDVLLILLRPDKQDYQGTAVTVDVARELEVPALYLVVNKVPSTVAPATVRRQVEDSYGAPVLGVMQLSEDLVQLGSAGLMTIEQPDHPYSAVVRSIAEQLLAGG